MARMSEGKETWHRLLNWDRGQAGAERLAGVLLSDEGFEEVDPSHPLGGKDGLKDIVCLFHGQKWVGGVYFPRGQKEFKEIKSKFTHDLDGVFKNNAKGFVFITNQELRLSERKELSEINKDIDIDIYHLERISNYLNTPKAYGIRMEFLDIDMTKEEQLSYFESYGRKIERIEKTINDLSVNLQTYKSINNAIDEDSEFRKMDEIYEMIDEFFDKIWFDRHLGLRYRVEHKGEKINPEIWEGALKSAQKVIDKYGDENLGPYTDFEWGMLNGKLSALRWVVGEEWDMLDT
ncbi:hypothetical protein [Clostridium beijerinckii]|uniref:hypothetical protein n=1 Tax=Clostridium beijerinckii TaxID=1520 RepID=UPI0022E63E2F|nr:hypothetical protein [Clostridium beijerinckii]